MLSKELKEQIINDYKLHEGDTGSPEVQIALLTYRINSVNEHLKAHKKRPSFKKRIIKMVGQRRGLLRYLQEKILKDIVL